MHEESLRLSACFFATVTPQEVVLGGFAFERAGSNLSDAGLYAISLDCFFRFEGTNGGTSIVTLQDIDFLFIVGSRYVILPAPLPSPLVGQADNAPALQIFLKNPRGSTSGRFHMRSPRVFSDFWSALIHEENKEIGFRTIDLRSLRCIFRFLGLQKIEKRKMFPYGG